MAQQLEIIVPEFGEVDDSDWAFVQEQTIQHYSRLLEAYPGRELHGTVAIRDIGRGADWSVVVLVLTGVFFAIPEAHKRIRESLEEWRRIFKELKAASSWLLGKKPAFYPDAYLFLVALFCVVDRGEPNGLTFLGCIRLPEDRPDLADLSALLFTFSNEHTVHQVAVARSGQVLWKNDFTVLAGGP